MILSSIFADAAERRVFPGGAVFAARDGQTTLCKGCGTTAYDAPYSQPVRIETVYDLASVSKMFTLSAFLIAKRQAHVSENEAVARFLPEFDRADKQGITLRHLMMHNAGFEFHIQRLHGEPCDTWLAKLAAAPLECAPGEKVNYTCTAYFLLARVIEKLSGLEAGAFIEREIISPLHLHSTGFRPLEMFSPLTDNVAPTELKDDGQPWHGIVHDEAARQWQQETGGYCGNAGVFGTVVDLAKFGAMWLQQGAGILHPEDVQSAFTDLQLENAEGGVYRGWGWQRDNQTYTGEKAPSGCYGHQGFTGPTLFINPSTKDKVIVLNNRVYPTRNGPARFVYHRRIANLHFQEVAA